MTSEVDALVSKLQDSIDSQVKRYAQRAEKESSRGFELKLSGFVELSPKRPSPTAHEAVQDAPPSSKRQRQERSRELDGHDFFPALLQSFISVGGSNAPSTCLSPTSLEFRRNGLGPVSISSQVRTHVTLRTLLLQGTTMIKSPVITLAAAQLTCLDLECNPLGSDGVVALCRDVLPLTPALRRLHLASTQCGFEGLRELARTLPSSGLPLEVLGLTNNPLRPTDSDVAQDVSRDSPTDEVSELGVTLVAIATTITKHLRRLHLNHVGLTTADVVYLVRHTLLPLSQRDGADGATCTTVSRPPLFDSVDCFYMKQNSGVDSKTVWQTLEQLPSYCEDREVAKLKKKVLL